MNAIRYGCVFALVVASCLWGQGAGSLSGKIADARGSGVSNAVIVVTNTATNASERVVTGMDGTFSIPNLSPGTYRVEVEAAGSRRVGKESVEIRQDTSSNVQITFEDDPSMVGKTGEVEIRATAPTLQTDSAEVSRSYGTRVVRSLPVLDRQYQELIGLMPGVTPPVTSPDRIADPQRRRLYNANGLPDWSNLHNQDGLHNNEGFTNNISRVQPNEAVQSLNIRTSNSNAEYGYNGGAWVNSVTRPGTNPLHGSLFGFNTNEFFTTRNPLNVGSNSSPRFNQNQFGGTVGGPIVPSRMFFFLSYDGMIRRGRELQFATVPTAALRGGNFSQYGAGTIFNPASGTSQTGAGRVPFPNNQFPVSQINPHRWQS
jgi:hypothetical protein